ncbi:unnamed protein product [Brachionus calyciflorus]|uniref:Uncharacterized protein n=1 Tax=Brachionus calyciflorus TaxID=104777 RepID=A0A813ZJ29_9BILA|nr:unnamed protein product [Brachionus calyciflorus]
MLLSNISNTNIQTICSSQSHNLSDLRQSRIESSSINLYSNSDITQQENPVFRPEDISGDSDTDEDIENENLTIQELNWTGSFQIEVDKLSELLQYISEIS